MAIAFNNATFGDFTTGTSLTWSHACSGSDRLLIVDAMASYDGVDDITGVTYNGVSMGLIGKVQHSSETRWFYLFYLKNPASGTHNVVISKTSSGQISGNSSSYTGATQTGSWDAKDTHDSGGTTATSLAAALNTVDSNCWLFMGIRTSSGGESAGAGTAQRVGGYCGLYDSDGALTPGSHSLNANFTSSTYAYVIASFNPSAKEPALISDSSTVTDFPGFDPDTVGTTESVIVTTVTASPSVSVNDSVATSENLGESGTLNVNLKGAGVRIV